MSSSTTLPPGARIGILGGGQLGRMLALAGRPLGFHFRFLEPKARSPVAELGQVVRAGYGDEAGLARFARGLTLATYEFENVPVDSARRLAELGVEVRPGPAALEVAQDRLVEKETFRALGIPTPEFAPVGSRDELRSALEVVGLPAVLKTRRFGYDGKGQALLRDAAEVDDAWDRLGGRPLLLESFVEFDRELSLVAARAADGETRYYPLVENEHQEGILRVTIAPAPEVDERLRRKAEEGMGRLLDHLGYVGVLALELFQAGTELLANEIAPRVHNSGHWTQDGAETSQFENHLRAVAGLPLGSTGVRAPTAMVNLIGAVPAPGSLLRIEGAHLHLYGKSARQGRKLGHLNLVAGDADLLLERLGSVRALLVDR